jgi:hypothetical protein
MANRTLSHPGDKTVTMVLKLPMSLKLAVEDIGKKTGKSMSELFREWALSQVDSHEIELIKLEQEEIRAEADLNIIRAQKNQLKAEINKQLVAGQTMEQLLNKAAERLVTNNRSINFKDHGFLRMFNNNLEMLNKDSNCNGESVTAEQLKTLIIKKAEVQEKRVYDD